MYLGNETHSVMWTLEGGVSGGGRGGRSKKERQKSNSDVWRGCFHKSVTVGYYSGMRGAGENMDGGLGFHSTMKGTGNWELVISAHDRIGGSLI